VMNKTDGLGDAEGLVLVFSGLSFSSSSLSTGSSSWESLCCLGWIVTALIELWIWVVHCGSSVRKYSFLALEKQILDHLKTRLYE
nr:hypothetical protein [Tanacetum cinerariifolium]